MNLWRMQIHPSSDTPSSKQDEIFVSDRPTGGGEGVFDITTCLFDTHWLALYCVGEPSGHTERGKKSHQSTERHYAGWWTSFTTLLYFFTLWKCEHHPATEAALGIHSATRAFFFFSSLHIYNFQKGRSSSWIGEAHNTALNRIICSARLCLGCRWIGSTTSRLTFQFEHQWLTGSLSRQNWSLILCHTSLEARRGNLIPVFNVFT